MLNFESFRTFFLYGILGFGGISGLVVTRKSYMLLWDFGIWRDLKSYMFSWDFGISEETKVTCFHGISGFHGIWKVTCFRGILGFLGFEKLHVFMGFDSNPSSNPKPTYQICNPALVGVRVAP